MALSESKNKRVQVECKECGKVFYKTQYHFKTNKTHFCREECFYQHKRKHAAKPIEYTINENGCFICISHKPGPKGYPNYRHNTAYRHVYREMFGELPKGLVIRHLCDEKMCINPEHLKSGTVKDNVHDAIRNKKFPLGSKKGTAKLNESQVKEIKKIINDTTLSDVEISNIFDCGRNTIYKLRKGLSWKHVI